MSARLILVSFLIIATAVAVSVASDSSAESRLEGSPATAQLQAVQPAPPPETARFDALTASLQATASTEAPHVPSVDKGDVPLANGELRNLVRDTQLGIQGPTTLSLSGESVRVEIIHDLTSIEIRDVVAGLGGAVYGEVPGELAEALVPIDRLVELEAHRGVSYVRPPLQANIPIGDPPGVGENAAVPQGVAFIGEEVAKMNADDWHAAGITGQGVKIGIVDYFDQSLWSAAQSAGEVPAPSGTFCRVMGQDCDVFNLFPDAVHGEGVAEVIHEMAPDAELYLATAYSASDLQAAVNYFAAQGVDVVSRSLTSEYDGPGDGTGPMAQVINSAVSQGIMWVNSAGNNAGDQAIFPGSYWRGTWSDPNNNGLLDFAPGNEELGFLCGFANGVRWDDWGASATDYDIYVYDEVTDFLPEALSLHLQGLGAPPVELVDNELVCDGELDIDYMIIKLYDPAGGTSGDILEVMMNQSFFELWQNPYSASGPASDSSSPGMLAVGAIDPALGTNSAFYSSRGPTNDNRTKPDVSAAACVDSYTYYPECFNGTSSATPAVAGAAALVLSSGVVDQARVGVAGNQSSATALANYIRESTVDRGSGGPDNTYGEGEVILGAPPDSATPTKKPSATASKTPTPTPHATPIPGSRIWGDTDCGGLFNIGDAINTARKIIGLSISAVAGCPLMGSSLQIDDVDLIWGDADCGGLMNIGDAIAISRKLIGLSVNAAPGCPTLGVATVIGDVTPTPAKTPTPTKSKTPTPTVSKTPTATASKSPTKTPTPTASKTPTPTPTPTPTASKTPTATASKTPSPSPTASKSPTPSPTPGAGSLFTQHSTWHYDSLGAIWVVGEVHNGLTGPVDFVKITANFYSASNQLLATDFGYSCLNAIGPNGYSPYSVLLISPPNGVDHVTVQVTGYYSPPLLYAVPPGLQATIDNDYIDILGILHVVGEVTNSSSNTYDFVKVCAAYYDAGGDVIRTDFTYTSPSTLGPGGSGSYDSWVIGGDQLPLVSVNVWPDASYP